MTATAVNSSNNFLKTWAMTLTPWIGLLAFAFFLFEILGHYSIKFIGIYIICCICSFYFASYWNKTAEKTNPLNRKQRFFIWGSIFALYLITTLLGNWTIDLIKGMAGFPAYHLPEAVVHFKRATIAALIIILTGLVIGLFVKKEWFRRLELVGIGLLFFLDLARNFFS